MAIRLTSPCKRLFQRYFQISSTHCKSADMSEPLVKTHLRGDDIFVITINRPEKRNCVNPATAKQLVSAFRSFEANEKARVAVLTGSEGCFCGGFDLGFLASAEKEQMEQMVDSFSGGLGPMGPSRQQTTKPLIAAVAGHAVAGGLELALLADLRVVEEDAIMGVFCRRFGVPLLDGGTVRLPRLIGLSRAMDMILTGRAVSAAEALQFGLANRVVPRGESLPAAIELAEQIALFPQECVLADRRSTIYSTFDSPSIDDAMAFEMSNGASVLHESIAGAKRFKAGIGRHGSFRNTKSRL